MRIRPVNADSAPAAVGGYAQAIEASWAEQLLVISGQIPEAVDGAVPQGFEAQARLVWANVERQLEAAGMTLDNLIKVTTFLADRADREANGRIRRAVLGDRTPALTVIVAGLYDEAWLIEIEAMAAA